jgi:hypothetical protein
MFKKSMASGTGDIRPPASTSAYIFRMQDTVEVEIKHAATSGDRSWNGRKRLRVLGHECSTARALTVTTAILCPFKFRIAERFRSRIDVVNGLTTIRVAGHPVWPTSRRIPSAVRGPRSRQMEWETGAALKSPYDLDHLQNIFTLIFGKQFEWQHAPEQGMRRG